MDNSVIRVEILRVIQNYNENIRDYNNNMKDMIAIYNTMIQETSVMNRNQSNRSLHPMNIVPINNNIWSDYLLQFRSTQPPIQRPINNTHLEDIVVRPTSEQIILATEIITWTDDISQNSCPITLEHFTEGQSICKIRFCQHMFQTVGLMRWFDRHVGCPVCRYDIREFNRYTESEESEELDSYSYNDTILDSSLNLINEHSNSNTSSRINLSNILRNLISSELNRSVPLVNNSMNDLFYSFNIPIEMDISYSNL